MLLRLRLILHYAFLIVFSVQPGHWCLSKNSTCTTVYSVADKTVSRLKLKNMPVDCRLWFLLGNGFDQCFGWPYQHKASWSMAVCLPVSTTCYRLCSCWVVWGWWWRSRLPVRIQTWHSWWDVQQLPGKGPKYDNSYDNYVYITLQRRSSAVL